MNVPVHTPCLARRPQLLLAWVRLLALLSWCERLLTRVRGGGLVVRVLTFYSDDPSSNPAGYLNFLHKKTNMNEKVAGKKCCWQYYAEGARGGGSYRLMTH